MLKKQAIQLLEHPVEARFLSNIFLVPKKDGGQRPVINLKALNQFINTEHFKMEGIHTVKDLLKPGLACQSGFEGRLLRHPHTSDSQEVSQISSPRENVPLHMPTFWAVISPVGIHEDSEASLSPSLRNGHASGSLHRLHFDPGGVQGDGHQPCGGHGAPARMSWLCNQQREISASSGSDLRIPGSNSRHSQHGATASASQNENVFGRSPENCRGKKLPRLAP